MTFETYIEHNFKPETLAIIEAANIIIDEIQAEGFTLTLRQLYYQFVARDLIDNDQKSYNSLVSIISNARLAGLISWDAIEDRTRFLRGVTHEISQVNALDRMTGNYRLDKWQASPTKVEVWIEKDALVGVIEAVCTALDVDYFSCRGYVSLSTMWEAGQRFLGYDDAENIVIIHLGDHDPSGIHMTSDIQGRLDMFTDHRVHVDRIALNMDQIEELKPPPKPAKLSDSRAQSYIAMWGHEAYELDALPPRYIADLIRKAVLAHRDEEIWQANLARENEDRATLQRISDQLREDTPND